MIAAIRARYNEDFTREKYQAFLDEIWKDNGLEPVFRIAETPVFIPADFLAMMKSASDTIINTIGRPDYLKASDKAIPKQWKVPHEKDRPNFIVIDFAVCQAGNGRLEPRLIELQGFPSLFAFQDTMTQAFRHHFNIPAGWDNFLNNFNSGSYKELLKKMIVADHDPKEVILLEWKPSQQKTFIDFKITADWLGIKILCLTELKQDGRKLYYLDEKGQPITVKRIYNRLIFDDLQTEKSDLPEQLVDLTQDLDVEWVSHPNWFYRLSKFTLPFIQHEYVPKSWFLDEIPVLPNDLEHFVLKPLFSYAGQGVKIDCNKEDIEAIKDPQNWILQEKVQYAPAVQTPTGPAITEIRLMYFWPDDAKQPILVHNLARISKGKMIGVGFNDDVNWVGGSCAFFETR
ncbi:hypothetical protein COR50_13450 [Chitinophaga caeni]|uniref:Glutathionylspermidine synthase pre-ATP-grasp-like domain-containing protein n=1 Tax=Chitinophaga caeni TaxID=2029983 RepID=A0A291R0R5_9BACT|nr:hypothetical protein [Chitinophaga caeni]ATL49869.1 hypothetical protein COR50_13450 [Chitinophaga caeni]